MAEATIELAQALRRWPALKKLQYVDELMAEIARQKPRLTRRTEVEPLRSLSATLAEHTRRSGRYAVDAPRAYDRDLRGSSPTIRGTAIRRRPRPSSGAIARDIRRLVSKWTGEYQLTLDQVLDEMIERCRELRLRAVGPRAAAGTDFTVLLTVKTMHSLYSPLRRQWIAL